MRFRFLLFISAFAILLAGFALMGPAAAEPVPPADFDFPYAEDGNFDHILFVYEDFDENEGGYFEPEAGLQTTGWGEYLDILTPGTTIEGEFEWITDNTIDGRAFRCALTGGDAFNNYFCANNVARLNGSVGDYPYAGLNWLEFEMDFYVEGHIDCTFSTKSDMEGIEWVWQFTEPPDSYGFGIVYAPYRGQLRHWTEQGTWEPFDPPIEYICIEGNQWHHVKFVTSMLFDKINYHYMILDDQVIDFNGQQLDKFPTFEEWKDTFIQMGIQVDSTFGVDDPARARPVAMVVDNVTLTGLKLTFDNHIYLPAVQK